MLETYGSLVGAVWRAALPGVPAEAERDRAVLLTLATASEAVGEVVRCSLALFSRRARVAEPRTVKRSIARLIEAGLILVHGEDVSISVEAVAALPRDPAWSERLSGGGLGLCAGWKDTRGGDADTAPCRRVRHHTVRHDTVVDTAPYRTEYGTIPQSPRHDTVVDTAPYRTPSIVSLSGPNSDPNSDPPPPLPPTPHGQDEEEARGHEGELLTFKPELPTLGPELLTFPGDDTPPPTDDDLALWGELVAAHNPADFFAGSEAGRVVRLAAAPKQPEKVTLPVTGHDPLAVRLAADYERLTSAPMPPVNQDAVALRIEISNLLAPVVAKRGGMGLSAIHIELLSRIETDYRKRTGCDEMTALRAIRERLPECGDKHSPLGWLSTVMASPRRPQEARNGVDSYPRQGYGQNGAQEASQRPMMKPITDADLSPTALWFEKHYGCLADLRKWKDSYFDDPDIMGADDRETYYRFRADIESGRVKLEDIP